MRRSVLIWWRLRPRLHVPPRCALDSAACAVRSRLVLTPVPAALLGVLYRFLEGERSRHPIRSCAPRPRAGRIAAGRRLSTRTTAKLDAATPDLGNLDNCAKDQNARNCVLHVAEAAEFVASARSAARRMMQSLWTACRTTAFHELLAPTLRGGRGARLQTTVPL